jgi:tRNA(Ile)-lysidine synthase
MFSLTLLESILQKLSPKTKFLIAYSGGMDSHVLLHSMHLLAKQHPNWQIRAAHIHHGLSTNANQWLDHCQTVCKNLHIELITKFANVKEQLQPKMSLEELARKLRYELLAEILHSDECLLTAQHADDQTETVLMQLFRGAGPKGLSAMPEIKVFAHSQLLRPFLPFTRNMLRQYAITEQLNWIEDESNENICHDRNFIRHSLMPIIKERWPGILTTVSRAAKNCSKAVTLLKELATDDYENIKGVVVNTISITKLLQIDILRQENVLRYWLQLLNLPIPSSKKIAEIINTVCKARIDGNPKVNWANVAVHRFKDDLYAFENTNFPNIESFAIPWNLQGLAKLPQNLGSIDKTLLERANIKVDESLGDITFCSRKYANSYKVKNRQGTHQLRKLFQEWQIPPWLRDRTILVTQQNELIGHLIIF